MNLGIALHGQSTKWFTRVLTTLVVVATTPVVSGSTVATSDPGKVEVITSDVVHFWQAFDDALKAPMADRTGIYRKEYFDHASQGLKDYAAFRRVTPDSFASHVEQNRAYYAKIRAYVNEVVNQKPMIESAFRRLKMLYPEIRFPAHIYFVVGPQKGAGMNSENGIILAADMFATPPGTPYSYTKISPIYLPFSAVHETIHFNQTYQTSGQSTLLANSVSEGTADFITSLVLPEPAVRQSTDRWQYGCPHEAIMAARLMHDEDMTDPGPWMFNHHPDTGWPPDMGYWIGYRIDQSFYAQAKNKTAALRAMLGVTDFKAYLNVSGYPSKRESCVPEKPVALAN